MTVSSFILLITAVFLIVPGAQAQSSNLGTATAACGTSSILDFARELRDRAQALVVGNDDAPKNSVTVKLAPAKPYKKPLAAYCPNGTARYGAKSRPVSYYGDGTDGFAGEEVACSNQLPSMRTMNPNALRVALRTDIFKRLMAKSGKDYSKRNICGAQIILHRPGLKEPVIATIVDNGDLGLTKKKIKPMRDIDLSPAVRKKMKITTDDGLALDVSYVVCDI